MIVKNIPDFDRQKFIKQVLEKALRLTLSKQEEVEKKSYFTSRDDTWMVYLDESELTDIVDGLGKLSMAGGLVFNGKYCEVALIESRRSFVNYENIVVEDKHNKYKYEIGLPTKGYGIFLAQQCLLRDDFSPISALYFESTRYKDVPNILDLLSRRIKINTLRIHNTSGKDLSASKFKDLCNAFLYEVSYNLGSAFVIQQRLEEFFIKGPARIKRRRGTIKELCEPKKTYKEELTYCYQRGLLSTDATSEYLSYYHILEHYFDQVFNEEIIQKIQNQIAATSFSYKRRSDVKKLISQIVEVSKIDSESKSLAAKSELGALELVIKKYIPELEELVNQLTNEFIQYLKNNIVSFSNGPFIDFEETDVEKLYISIAKRIYFTRNAIVHSKSENKNKFVPFRDDAILYKEIQIIKAISELIIEKTSTLL